VFVKETAGKNIARFRPSNDIAGIRRLLVPATLCPANRTVFSSAKTKTQPKK
jgi:hypothetical protein